MKKRRKEKQMLQERRESPCRMKLKLSNPKKQKVESCAEDLLKSADSYAEKTEHTENFTLITKSNALQRSAKDKRKEISKLEEQLTAKLDELLKCFNSFSLLLCDYVILLHYTKLFC